MKNHNFCYNYGFLADWLRANPEIKRYDVLGKMGMSDYRTLQNWMEGITMMPLTQMMKFCNLYNVPITAFFYDEEANEESVFAPINASAMIEPAGGWPNSDRRTGIKVCDPRCKEHITSRMPNYCRETMREAKQKNSKVALQEAEQGKDVSKEERMRYLDIIEKQSDRIMELTRENVNLQRSINELADETTYSLKAAESTI